MAEIKAFCGYRFNCSSPDALAKYIAPPYDMLSSAMIDELYAKDAANIVRITQNRPRDEDSANSDRHQRAASTLNDWVENGVLQRDDTPSVYIYEQRFSYTSGSEVREAVRTGVIMLVELTSFEEKVVLPHEATLSGPKQDRYELLDATRAHTEQIFGLLDDDGPFYEQLRAAATGSPDGTFTDVNGVIHSLFRCRDAAVIERLVALAKGKTILIADGHHRYETGLNFYRNNPRPEYAFTMMTLVSTADPGLVIRPFHRLVKKAGRTVEMSRELARYFTLTDRGSASAATIGKFLDSEAAESEDILYCNPEDGHLYGCTINDDGRKVFNERFPDHSAAWKQLPVSMINVIVINTILDLPLDGHVLHDVVEYVADSETGVKKCGDAKEYHGGFFIKPAQIGNVSAVVASGDRMPQKSTNFYPKIYSGLVLHRMDDA